MSRLRDVFFGVLLALLGVMGVLLIQNLISGEFPFFALDRFKIFTTIFLGIFIEAAPFLLLGTMASGAVEVYINRERIDRLMPENPFVGAIFGSMLGFFFPVCECGVVPFTRRLFKKGLSPAVGISFLLAAPVLNPIVIASTYAAFGLGPVLFLRVGLSLGIASIVGMIFALQTRPEKMLQPVALVPIQGGSGAVHEQPRESGALRRIPRVFSIAGEEFFEMGRYLILGSMLAALMQTVVPQPSLLSLGTGPLRSILVMMTLAVVLSVCSTVDAFIALAFANSFTLGSILSFLVFGPMIDIKNALMFLQVFRRRTVLYLILLPFLLTLLSGLIVNLYTPF